jgi:ABC-type transport system involved in multi-copper enzyme maturation permease subunit
MNTSEIAAASPQLPSLTTGHTLWLRQLRAIFSIEFRKALFSRRVLTCLGLASLPVLLLAVAGWAGEIDGERVFQSIEQARQIYAYIYSALILGAVVFLGSAAIFTTLFRGEILDRSIHYYLLTPVRREVMVVGKYLAGLACAVVLFGSSTLICFLLLYLPFGLEQLISDLSSGIALQQIGQYLGVTLLACMGYGSVFMATGLLFRNPLIPVVLIAGWELIHFILPPALKIFSIIYYLKGLVPIPLDEGPLAIIVAPPPVWVSIAGMLGLCAITVTISVFLLKRIEVRYTDE